MRQFLMGLLVGIVISMPLAEALRLPGPPTITEWNANSISQLNAYLQALWQLTNGRYTMEVTTSNPNGSRVGTQGDAVLYNNGGSYKLCVNTTASTAASPTGTTWRCSPNAYTVP